MDQEERRRLRDAFGAFMTGVTVVTTVDPERGPVGFTANSFTSVSLDPPLLLVSIAKTARSYAAFISAKGFAINILSEGQKDVSNTFARPVEDRFSTVEWHLGPNGAPILQGVSAWFDCQMHQVVEAGDHAILIGHVQAYESSAEAGLGYYRGSYFTPAAATAAAMSGPTVMVSAVLERGQQVLLVDDKHGGLTLPSAQVGTVGAAATLKGLIEATGLNATPGLVYAVYEDTKDAHQHIAFLCPCTEGTPRLGIFVDLDPAALTAVADPAMRAMLVRRSEESRVGNYGIYFGNQTTGHVTLVTVNKSA